ncbi:Organ specific protein [Quillaja saponaria]|uniref:Organ specific protein n=1 Tax=Quillaja saponaria TaxID=32244 RepID=A0AAD7PN51_QUISA|nr:Organ specific protein [Quillaja saponaria]
MMVITMVKEIKKNSLMILSQDPVLRLMMVMTMVENNFVKDFEPRPSTTAYDGDDNGARSKKNFNKNFEPRPSVTAYNGDDNGVRDRNEVVEDFEPRPSDTSYDGDDHNGARDKKKFVKYFEQDLVLQLMMVMIERKKNL